MNEGGRNDLDPELAMSDLLHILAPLLTERIQGNIADGLRERIDLVLRGSEAISAELGIDRLEGLAAVLKIISMKNQTVDPEDVLRRLLEKLEKTSDSSTKGGEHPKIMARIKELEEVVKKLEAQLKEALERARIAKNAAGDVVKIREKLLSILTSTGEAIVDAVVKTRSREGDDALVAYLVFEDIQNLDRQCMMVFQGLNPSVLANVQLFRDAVREYESVGRTIQSSDKVPSLELYFQIAQCLAKLQALKAIQDQLVVDQMADSADAEKSWFDADGRLKDFYAVMEISPDATLDEIKKTYKRKVRKCHPDHNPNDEGAAQRFSELSEAYLVLSDPQKRAIYDRLRS